jgi:carboxypeptidase Q
LREVAALLQGIGASAVTTPGGGADIGPLRAAGVPLLGLRVDGSHYFDIHHTPADTLDKIEPRALAECTAALAVMAYLLADVPEPLPRLTPGEAAADGR